MSFEPILTASPIIQIHLAAALVSAAVGVSQFALPKGGMRHRIIGWIGVVALIVVAVSSFWITGLMGAHWSPIHILSILTLASLVLAIIAIRAGNVRAHRSAMIGVFIGLTLAGLFTLAPGRVLNAALFGP